MKISAILSDLDGTLIDYDGTYTASVPSLIHTVQEKNIHFSLATGNAYFGIVKHITGKLNLSPLVIVHGGAMIIDWITGVAPWHKPISDESTSRIAQYLNKTGLIYSLETRECPYMNRIVKTPAYRKNVDIKHFTRTPSHVLKILVHALVNKSSESETEKHIKYIKNFCKDVQVTKFVFKDYYGLDVTSEESTKYTAVLEYAKIVNISPQEIVAIGDGYNDYPLFTACGYKIAMGNAPHELKEIADFVVSTAKEGGMEQALHHILSLNKN